MGQAKAVEYIRRIDAAVEADHPASVLVCSLFCKAFQQQFREDVLGRIAEATGAKAAVLGVVEGEELHYRHFFGMGLTRRQAKRIARQGVRPDGGVGWSAIDTRQPVLLQDGQEVSPVLRLLGVEGTILAIPIKTCIEMVVLLIYDTVLHPIRASVFGPFDVIASLGGTLASALRG